MSLDGDDQNIDINFYQNFMAYELDDNVIINENKSDITTTLGPSNKCNKVNLIHIVKDNSSIIAINDIVEKMHLLRMLTTLILKLFILWKKYESNKTLNIKRIVNEFFIVILIESIAANKTETVGKRSGRESKRPKYLDVVYTNDYNDDCSSSDNNNDKIRHDLLSFINTIVLEGDDLSQDIKELIVNGIDLRGLQNSIKWIAQEIVTSYQQNIIQNYKTYIERFVNVFFLRGKLAELDSISNLRASDKIKQDEKRVLLLKYRNVKDDLVEPDPAKYKSKSSSALQFIKIHKHMLFPKSR